MRYNFGLYHWRRRFRRLVLAAVAVAIGVRLGSETSASRSRRRTRRAVGALLALWGFRTGRRTVTRLLSPPPWRLDGKKYGRLAAELPLAGADYLLDVGCGTGRSLVGLADAVPADCTAIGLDVFDDRIILGNGPALARRNAAVAGLEAAAVRGDAARLPLADGSVDVVTACRVLHDLPAADARRALAEARRVCAPDGTLGVLELPVTHGESDDYAAYWRQFVANAGFDVKRSEKVEADGGRYAIVVAEP